MATGWMKSLHCKSKALDDVVDHQHHGRSNPKAHHHDYHLLSGHSSNCKSTVRNLKDVVEKAKQPKPKKPKPPKPPQAPPFKRPVSRKLEPPIRTRPAAAESFFPALTELPAGHPSRNVVEIIFHTSWGEKSFSGRVEMVFKVQNMNRTVTRFEEYREVVKSRAATCAAADDAGHSEDHARCVADGNEVMRFYCLGATTTTGGEYETCGAGAWAFHGGKGATVCTFSGSGVAHDNAGVGKGRRAMLVCRVIAGRVCKRPGFDSLIEGRNGYDSVAGKNGELFVFDTRALLPCFLIIYKL